MDRQVVVITGASAGVGRAVVRAFARSGADVALLARGLDGLEAARREVEAEGGRALVLPTDVSDAAQVESALAYRGIPLQAAYCGAKHAIQGFTESLRCELLHDGSNVHVTMVQLPAMNTPQFDWVKSRLPRTPQPVPPIYEPEVAADVIVWASSQRRREMSVGMPTVAAIWGNKIASPLLDRYLARTAFDSQQTDEPADPNRPDNLWKPLPGDHGAHGRFASRSANFSPQTWMNERLPALAMILAGGAALLI